MKGRELIKAVLKEYHLHPDDFFGRCRDPNFVLARKDCAARLKNAGFSVRQIAGFLHRNHSTIIYYLNGKIAERKRERYAERAPLRYLPDHIGAIVTAFAEAENTTPRAIFSEWITERAEHEARARRAAA